MYVFGSLGLALLRSPFRREPAAPREVSWQLPAAAPSGSTPRGSGPRPQSPQAVPSQWLSSVGVLESAMQKLFQWATFFWSLPSAWQEFLGAVLQSEALLTSSSVLPSLLSQMSNQHCHWKVPPCPLLLLLSFTLHKGIPINSLH